MTPADPPSAPAPAAVDPFRLLLDEVGAFIYVTDIHGRYTYANQLVLQLLGGYRLEQVVGKEFGDFVQIDGDIGAALRETDLRVLHGGETIMREETNLIHATGELRTYWSIKKPLRDAQGRIAGLIGISHDITEKKRLEDQVRQQKELLDAVLDNVDALVYMKDEHRRFVYANRHLARTLGQPVECIVGQRDTALLPQHKADEFWALDQQILASGERHASEVSMPDAQGRLRHYWSVAVPTRTPDGAQAVIGLSTDITELHELKEQLRQQASSDGLTGLANRRSFWEQAEREFARSRRHAAPLALIAIDIDHFKHINDHHGHPVGDRVLRAFAACCQAQLRSMDVCARTGGEEFCILLPQTDLEGACAMAERIRAELAQLCVDAQLPELRTSASFGVTTLHSGDLTFEGFFLRADRALYAAKQRGRDCVFYG